MTDLKYPSPHYRVSAKALIFDDQQRLLMLQNNEGGWEIPGGGWEHGESFEEAIRREIQEEQHVDVLSVGPVELVFQGEGISKHGYVAMRVAARVQLASHDFTLDDGMVAARFVTADELRNLAIVTTDKPIVDYIDTIWA